MEKKGLKEASGRFSDYYLDIITYLNITRHVLKGFKLSNRDGSLRKWEKRSKITLSGSPFLSTRPSWAVQEKVQVRLSIGLLT